MPAPEGYMQDTMGRLVPESMVSEYEKARDEFVLELHRKAQELSAQIGRFKAEAMGDVEAFLELAREKYGADKLGAGRGNVSLSSYDGTIQIRRAVALRVEFDERLEAAKALIDECLDEWTVDTREELKVLVKDAFRTDGEGNLNTARVLSLRRLEIDHPKWRKAMEAINDSLHEVGSKAYVRFYERGSTEGKFTQIPLDIAAL